MSLGVGMPMWRALELHPALPRVLEWHGVSASDWDGREALGDVLVRAGLTLDEVSEAVDQEEAPAYRNDGLEDDPVPLHGEPDQLDELQDAPVWPSEEDEEWA